MELQNLQSPATTHSLTGSPASSGQDQANRDKTLSHDRHSHPVTPRHQNRNVTGAQRPNSTGRPSSEDNGKSTSAGSQTCYTNPYYGVIPHNHHSTDQTASPIQHIRDVAVASNVPGVNGKTNVDMHHIHSTKEDVQETATLASTDRADSCDVDAVSEDRGVGQDGRNYDQLTRGRPSSHHVYRPITGQGHVNTADRDTSHPGQGATSQGTGQGAARCPPPSYSSCGISQPPGPGSARPDSRPLLHQPSPRRKKDITADNADDIVELASDVGGDKRRKTAEEKRNSASAKKDRPEITEVPNTNFAIACMVALCFNLPFGVLAMYFSLRAVRAYQDDQAKLGERRSRWSIVLSLLGITVTTVIISSVVLYIAMQGQKRISKDKGYGTKSGLNL